MIEDIHIHSDESDEFIERLIKAFDLSFEELDLRSGMTFQELIDNITQKLGRDSSTDCSTQIVFYKIRQILTKELGIQKERVTRNALLNDIFPKYFRKKQFTLISKKLGVDVNYFQSPAWFQFTIVGIILLGLVVLFINPLIGISLVVIPLLIGSIIHKLSCDIQMKTFGELVDRITRDNLIKLRDKRVAINPREIRMTVIKLIDDLHSLDKLEIDSNQKIVFE